MSKKEIVDQGGWGGQTLSNLKSYYYVAKERENLSVHPLVMPKTLNFVHGL